MPRVLALQCFSLCQVVMTLSLQETNPAELLRLYLSFNLLEEAALFAMHYIDAVLGPRKEEFAMQVCSTVCRIH